MSEQPYGIEADDPILDAYFAELFDEEVADPWEITYSTGSGMEKPLQSDLADGGQRRYYLFPVCGLQFPKIGSLPLSQHRMQSTGGRRAPPAASRLLSMATSCWLSTLSG